MENQNEHTTVEFEIPHEISKPRLESDFVTVLEHFAEEMEWELETFEQAGVLTNDTGCVIKTEDNSERKFFITVQRQ